MNDPLLKISVQAAKEAGKLLKKGYVLKCDVHSKSHKHDVVTEFDKKSEQILIDAVTAAFPHHAILSEESGLSAAAGENVLWIIDPLDGTMNFAHHIPCFSISIATLQKGNLLTGVIYNPLLDELFTACAGKGAFLHETPIHVSATRQLEDAIVATGLPPNCQMNLRGCLDQLSVISKLGVPIRRMGSAALDLAYVACGRFDAFWESTLQPWDFAAGKLLLQEAGGMLTTYEGTIPTGDVESSIIATNGYLHKELTGYLNACNTH